MNKFIELKFSEIKYSGDSIGDDICVEIEVAGRFLRVDWRINAGATLKINKEICQLETDQKLFMTNARIAVIEKDALFNDVGSIDNDIIIDTSVTRPQKFIYSVRIKEARSSSRKSSGKSTAIFEIIIEARITNAIRYVPDDGGGWLLVMIEDDKSKKSLAAYTKVKIERIKNRRVFFTILEGPYREKLASVKLRNDDSSRLTSGIEHGPAASGVYSISKRTFTLNGKTYTSVDYKDLPWEKGLYDIEIPDAPHSVHGRYAEAKRPTVWFRIGHSGDKYLHAGSHSLGCITIIETTRWMEIYNVLIRARKSDLMSVGVLEVVE